MGDYGLWYCTRESVKTALDEAETARSNVQVDDAIEQGARQAEGLCHTGRTFAPVLATRSFDYPARGSRTPSWRVWFGHHRLVSASAVTVGGSAATVLTPAQYYLEPVNDPPYNRIEINLGGTGSFSSGSTFQRSIAVTGLWGSAPDEQRSVGSLAGTLAASTTATASLTWTTARFGVGDILVVDSERMVIRERTFVDSGQNLAAVLSASAADTLLTGLTTSAYAVDEILLVGAERMRIVDIAGTSLVVKRAWDGSQLAAHSIGDDVYALTGVELDRAQCGTTLAAHSAAAVVYRWVPPGPIATLNRAYALSVLLQERSGWARTIQASADTVQEVGQRGIVKLEQDVQRLFGRRARSAAIA